MRNKSFQLLGTLGLLSHLSIAGLGWGAGSSPADPVAFDPAAGSLTLSVSEDEAIWLRLDIDPRSTVSHLALETLGTLDTEIAVFASLAEALRDEPIAEDDDDGQGTNAAVRVPIAFAAPLLVRIGASRAGSFQVSGDFTFAASERCDWPAGCSLAVAAHGEPTAGDALRVLRQVREEVLSRNPRGRELIDLYWRLGADLVPDLLADGEFRRRAYTEVTELLPLARSAVEAVRGTGGQEAFARSQVERLDSLRNLVASRVSPSLADELARRWSQFRLEEQVGYTIAETLQEVGLRGASDDAYTVIVKLRREPDAAEEVGQPRFRTGSPRLDARLEAGRARALRRVHADSPARRAAGLTRTVAFEVDGLAAARSLVSELVGDPAVEWAEVAVRMWALATPGTDPYRNDLWGVDAVRAPQAWSVTRGSCSTFVAVVDTGLRSGLLDLEERTRHELGYDFADDDPDPADGHGHGTHVAGTVAAALENSTSIAGVAPGVCLFGVKVLGDDGSGDSDDVAAGIVHAVDAGARVVNMSLGCDCESQQAIEEALEYAAAQDVVVVAAAGNDGEAHLHYPASSIWVLSVGALNPDLTLASFSSFGAGLDLVAPGVDVVSVFRDGESCMGSGTSMATPHVAGVAALVRSTNPELDREEVEELLLGEARDLGTPGYDLRYGAGLVDAFAAVAAALGSGGPQCTPSDTALCLSGDRFRVETLWRLPDGTTGQGHAVRLTPDTGYFWFFKDTNVEMLTKVLDACAGGGRFWVFAGGLTNVEVRMRVTDTATGQAREYVNPQGGAFRPVQDTNAFATCGAGPASTGLRPALAAEAEVGNLLEPVSAVATCTGSSTALCLNQGRFKVEAVWRLADGQSGVGRAVPLTPDTGYFWFFNSSNVEVFLKVLRACGLDGHYWVFAGGLTNVEVRLKVTDTATAQVREYVNPQRTAFQPVQDTHAFATCP